MITKHCAVCIVIVACAPGPSASDSDADTRGDATAATEPSSTTPTPTPTTSEPQATVTGPEHGTTTGAPSGDSDSGASEPGESSSSEDSSSTGVDSKCGDPGAPACTACNAMGQPTRLFGLTWNFQGEAGSRFAREELRCVVPETGETGLLASVTGMDWLAGNAYDRDKELLYVVAYGEAEQVVRLFSVHTITAEVLAKPALQGHLNWNGGMYVRPDGVLVGITWNVDTAQEELRSIDPASAATTLIAPVAQLETVLQNVTTYDPATDRALMIGPDGGSHYRLFIVDVFTGELHGDAMFAKNMPWISGFQVRADGKVLGIGLENDTAKLFAIDSATAAITELVALPDFGPPLSTASAYDATSDTLLFVDGNSRINRVDAKTGAIVTSVPLDQPSPDKQYNWSGGLHLRGP